MDQEQNFRAEFRVSLQDSLVELDHARARARHKPSPERIHAFRIAAKHVRYLLEEVLDWYPQGKRAVAGLQSLHDSAGAIQDLQRLLALSEQVFAASARRRYRRLRAAAEQGRAAKPAVMPELASLLWVSRAAAVEQAGRIRAFAREELGQRRPRYLGGLKSFAGAAHRNGR